MISTMDNGLTGGDIAVYKVRDYQRALLPNVGTDDIRDMTRGGDLIIVKRRIDISNHRTIELSFPKLEINKSNLIRTSFNLLIALETASDNLANLQPIRLFYA